MPTTRIAHLTGGWLRCLMTATALWSGSALALDPGAPPVAGFCGGGKAPDCRMLFAVGAGVPKEYSKDQLALAFAGERLPAMSDGAGNPPAAGVRTVAAQGGGKNAAAENWVRKSDWAPAEPGLWVLLVAGFLGICAVARPRIFTS
jgi:hypothetical protein